MMSIVPRAVTAGLTLCFVLLCGSVLQRAAASSASKPLAHSLRDERTEKVPLGISGACLTRLRGVYPDPPLEPNVTSSKLVPIRTDLAHRLVEEVLSSPDCRLSFSTMKEHILSSPFCGKDIDMSLASDVLARIGYMAQARKVHVENMVESDRDIFERMLQAPLIPAAKPLFVFANGTAAEQVRSVMDLLDAGSCVAYASSAFACLPSIINIGVMKSSTGELENWLSIHPQVHIWISKGIAAPKREAHFFDRLDAIDSREAVVTQMSERLFPEYLNRGLRLRSLRDVQNHITFEKTPEYIDMSSHRVWALHHLLPSVRFILLLRNPVSRAYSHFQHQCQFGILEHVYIRADGPDNFNGTLIQVKKGSSRVERLKRAEELMERVGLARYTSKLVTETAAWPCPASSFARIVKLGLPGREQRGQPSHDGSFSFIADASFAAIPAESPLAMLASSVLQDKLKRGLYDQYIDTHLEMYPRQQVIVAVGDAFDSFYQVMTAIQRAVKLPFFNYRLHMYTNEHGYVVLKGVKSKSAKKPYEKLDETTKAVLADYFAPMVRRLVDKGYVTEDLIQGWLDG